MAVTAKTCESCKRSYKTEADFLRDTSQWRVCSDDNLWFNCSCNTSLMIPKGKYEWYSPEKLMGPEARSVFNKLAGIKELPHIPSVIMDLQKKIQDEGVDAKALSKAVRKDPILAADILNIASNLKNLGTRDRLKIKSLEFSIVYIGRKALSNLIVAASISSFRLPTKLFHIKDFWEQGVVCAVIAEILAARFNPLLRSDEVYLSACLANIGKIMSALCFPIETDLIYQEAVAKDNNLTWQDCERKFPDIDHTILGEVGASLWGLPKYVGEAARYHHAEIGSAQIASGRASLREIIQFSNLLTPWFFDKMGYCEEAKILQMAKRFQLDEDQLEELVAEIRTLLVNSA